MSLTSYRAAPPRVKTIEKREARERPAAAYVAIMTAIEKAVDVAFARFRRPSDVPSDWR
jgi:hypothetical protein